MLFMSFLQPCVEWVVSRTICCWLELDFVACFLVAYSFNILLLLLPAAKIACFTLSTDVPSFSAISLCGSCWLCFLSAVNIIEYILSVLIISVICSWLFFIVQPSFFTFA